MDVSTPEDLANSAATAPVYSDVSYGGAAPSATPAAPQAPGVVYGVTPKQIETARAAGYSDEAIVQHLATVTTVPIAEAQKQGYSASDILNYLVTPPPSAPTPEEPGVTATAVHELERQALPAVGGFAGFEAAAPIGAKLGALAGAAIPGLGETGIPEAVGGTIGGFAAGTLGAFGGGEVVQKAQQFVMDLIPDNIKEAIGQSDSQQQAERLAHPYIQTAVDLASNLAFVRPGSVANDLREGATAFEKMMASPVGSRVAGAGFMTGMEAGQEEIHDGELDPKKLLIASVVGALSNKKTALGEGIEKGVQGLGAKFAPSVYHSAGSEAAPGDTPETTPPAGESSVISDQEVEDRLNAPAVADQKIADAVTNPAVDLDTAIDTAKAAAEGAPVSQTDNIVAKTQVLDDAAPEQPVEPFPGLNAGSIKKVDDETYNYSSKGPDGQDVSVPLKVWNPETAPQSDTAISPELADAQRDHYGKLGVDVVYFENDHRIPFDGAVDPTQPNTLFLSNDPQRNAEQVGAHEVTHVLESTKLPDGTSLGDLLHQQVAAGITETGRAYAEERFGVSAPKREDFGTGQKGDAAHAQAITVHLVKELAADLGGEAPKFDSFFPKVVSEVESRYGKSVASDVLQKFMDGIKAAMDTIKKFFGSDSEGTISQHLVNNLGEVHDTLAKMYAAKYGETAGFKDVTPADDAANKAAFVKNETPPPVSETANADHPLGPTYVDARTKATTYARWLGELDAKRRADAQTSEPVKLLQQTQSAILNKVGGVESKLTDKAAARLADVRSQLDAHLNPVGDSPVMARVREAMLNEQQRMADAASVSKMPQFSPKQTETPEFKNWFGDSKVADLRGRPITVYHGTHDDFTAFKNDRAYFTPDPSYASKYARDDSGNLVPSYLNMRKPLDLSDLGADPISAKVFENKLAEANVTSLKNFSSSKPLPVWAWLQNKEVREAVKAAGYDGVIQRESQIGETGDAKAYITFSPEQVKSAIGNNGEFNPKDPRIQFSPRKVEEIAEGKKVPKEVALASGFKNSEAIASNKRWQTGRDLKVAMQDVVQRLAAKAGVDLTDKSNETTKHLISSVTADVMHALKQNAGAIGWYDLKTRQALRVASLVHPEIATDPNARFAFVYALAATSNGIKVDKNFDYANQVYDHYKKTGEMPTHIKMGLAQESINGTLEMFNTLSKKWGLEKFRKFMLTEYAMKEITALSGVKPAGEHADTVGRGAAIMGPKIGNGFFSNLYGHFDALTMDRWLIRTWGRHTGTLIVPEPELADTSRARVNAALRALDPKDYDRISGLIDHPVKADMNYVDDLAAAVKDASADPNKRRDLANTAEGDELRKASINLIKYLDGQKEAPSGPHERVYIRKVFQAALEEVRKDPRYEGITMADMQAVLWYAEKRLYEHAKTDVDVEETGAVKGYETENEAPDYANAAVGMVKNSNEAVLRDTSLSDAEKRARIVSDRRIEAALAKEANGRAAETQSGLSGTGIGQGGRLSDAGGFTDNEKRAFARASAAQDVRSARLGGEPSSFSFERKSSGDGGKSRVLKSLGVTYDAEWKAGAGLRRVYEKNGSKVPLRILELAPGDDKNAARFEQAITASKNSSKDGAAVAVYPVEDYKNFKLLMSDDGKSGAAVKPDGDIISVFSNNGTGHAMFEAAIAAGGRKLDAFDTILPDFYHSHGFVEAARTAWNDEFAPEGWDKAHFAEFNNGKPDVVLMVLDRGNVSPVLEKAKVYGDWDSAARAQEKLLKKMDRDQPGATINLRLDRLDGEKPFSLADAKAELAKMGVDVVASRTRKINGKEGEPGAVLNLSRPLSAEEAKRFSDTLKQEAIPQFANGRGELHGPDAEKWGAFDASKFHTLEQGQSLQSPRMTPEQIDRLTKLNPAFANMFRKNKTEVPATEQKAPVEEPKAGKTEEPPKAESAAPKAEAKPAAEKGQRQLNVKHIEGDKEYIGRALNNELTRRLANAPQVEKANEVIAKDRERAMRIAMREEQPPDSWKLQPSVVWTELERQAIRADDRETQRVLRTSPLAKELTTAGRLIQSMSLRDKFSANDRIDEVSEAREAAAKDAAEKSHGSLEAAQKETAAKAEPELTKAIKAQVKKRLPPIQEFANFINSIKCD